MELAKPPTARQMDRRRRILESTRDLLAEGGYEGLQMRVLAERAGVSPMTLYNRFGNKDALILAALQEMLDGLRGEATASGKQGIEFVLYSAELTANQILETPEYAKAMALMLFNGQAESPILNALLLDNLARSKDNLAQMRTLEEINDSIDMELLARGLSTCTWSTVLLWMNRKGETK